MFCSWDSTSSLLHRKADLEKVIVKSATKARLHTPSPNKIFGQHGRPYQCEANCLLLHALLGRGAAPLEKSLGLGLVDRADGLAHSARAAPALSAASGHVALALSSELLVDSLGVGGRGDGEPTGEAGKEQSVDDARSLAGILHGLAPRHAGEAAGDGADSDIIEAVADASSELFNLGHFVYSCGKTVRRDVESQFDFSEVVDLPS